MKRLFVILLAFVPLLFVPFLHAQNPTGTGTANYIAKWSSSTNLTTSALCQSPSGGLVGIATCSPTQRLQVNSGDVLVKGMQNFAASGQVARYFVGDTNHAVGAAFGAVLFFSTNKQPYAMVIQDQTGFVGVNTTAPTARFTIVDNTFDPQYKLFTIHGSGTDVFTVDTFGNIRFSGAVDNDVNVQGNISGTNMSVGGVVNITGNQTTSGIRFPDGTFQTTAYRPAPTAATQSALVSSCFRRCSNCNHVLHNWKQRGSNLPE